MSARSATLSVDLQAVHFAPYHSAVAIAEAGEGGWGGAEGGYARGFVCMWPFQEYMCSTCLIRCSPPTPPSLHSVLRACRLARLPLPVYLLVRQSECV
jgi:hypothetical protein